MQLYKDCRPKRSVIYSNRRKQKTHFIHKLLFRRRQVLCFSALFFANIDNLHVERVIYCSGKYIYFLRNVSPPLPPSLFSSLLKHDDRRFPMEVDIGGWLSIFYQFGSTCSGAGFCPANHPLAPAFTPRWVHPIRFAYYGTIYLHHCTRVDESRTTSRSVSPSYDRSLFFRVSWKGSKRFLEIIFQWQLRRRKTKKKPIVDIRSNHRGKLNFVAFDETKTLFSKIKKRSLERISSWGKATGNCSRLFAAKEWN